MASNPFDRFNEPLNQRVMVGLAKIGLALKSRAWQDAGIRGLTPTQGQILSLLQAKGKLPMRLSAVADGLAVTPATASDAVATLIGKGLVKKSRAVDDARAIALTLTPKGQREADRVANWSDFLLSAIDELSPQEQEVFLQGLVKMIRKLQEQGEIPISQMCVTCRFFRPNVYSGSDRPHHCAFVDAPFGNRDLRLECPDHVAVQN